MTEFGPHVHYEDPRIYPFIEGYRWGSFQRSLLLGERSWDAETFGKTDARSMREGALDSVLDSFRERGFRFGLDQDGVMRVIAELPPDDPMLPTLLAQWGIEIPKVAVLSLEGPVETVGTVPVFKAVVFGHTERADGERAHGLNRDAWIVGRLDVRHVGQGYRARPGAEYEYDVVPAAAGHVVPPDEHVRGNLRRARNTARKVAAKVEAWDRFVARRAREAAEAERDAQAVRLAAEALAVDEDDVVGAIL